MLEADSVPPYLHVTSALAPGMTTCVVGTTVYSARFAAWDGWRAFNILEMIVALEQAFEQSGPRILSALYDPEEMPDLLGFLCAERRDVVSHSSVAKAETHAQLVGQIEALRCRRKLVAPVFALWYMAVANHSRKRPTYRIEGWSDVHLRYALDLMREGRLNRIHMVMAPDGDAFDRHSAVITLTKLASSMHAIVLLHDPRNVMSEKLIWKCRDKSNTPMAEPLGLVVQLAQYVDTGVWPGNLKPVCRPT